MKRPAHLHMVLLCLTSVSAPYGQSASVDREASGSIQVAGASGIEGAPRLIAAEEGLPVTASDKTGPFQLSGTVVDTSGAMIPGATVLVRSANGSTRLTVQSDANGSFIISGLPAGNYRLVVSSPGFEVKETSIAIETTGKTAPLRISLAVGSEITTINVQGREDSLIGIAESATQGTVGSAEIQDRDR